MPNSATYLFFLLEVGEISFEMEVKYRRIVYFHNLVNRPKNQLIYLFGMAQFCKRSKFDWMTQVLIDCDELNICSDFEYLQSISKHTFKKIAKKQIEEYAFINMKHEQRSYSKLKNIKYEELKPQSYLFDQNTTIEEKIICFKWRVSMEKSFGVNFRGGRVNVSCPLCLPVISHADTQKESFTVCKYMRERIHINEEYEDIYKSNVKPQLIRKMSVISRLRTQNV